MKSRLSLSGLITFAVALAIAIGLARLTYQWWSGDW